MQPKHLISYLTTLSLLCLSLTADTEYSSLPFTIEAEDCQNAGEPWTAIYDKKIKGEYSGRGFVYLTGSTFSFNFTVPEDGMYQINAKVAQILDTGGRLQTLAINGVEYSYTVPYYDTWTDFDFGVHRFYKGVNVVSFVPKYGYACFDTITISEPVFPDFSNLDTKLIYYNSFILILIFCYYK